MLVGMRRCLYGVLVARKAGEVKFWAALFRFTFGRGGYSGSVSNLKIGFSTGSSDGMKCGKSPAANSFKKAPEARHRDNSSRRSFEVHFQRNPEFGGSGHHAPHEVLHVDRFFLLEPQPTRRRGSSSRYVLPYSAAGKSCPGAP